MIALEVGDVTRFATAEKLAGYAGTCPFRLTIRVLVEALRTVAGRTQCASDVDNGHGCSVFRA